MINNMILYLYPGVTEIISLEQKQRDDKSNIVGKIAILKYSIYASCFYLVILNNFIYDERLSNIIFSFLFFIVIYYVFTYYKKYSYLNSLLDQRIINEYYYHDD